MIVTMKAYRIYYYAHANVNDLRDVFIAKSKIQAIKDFIIENNSDLETLKSFTKQTINELEKMDL